MARRGTVQVSAISIAFRNQRLHNAESYIRLIEHIFGLNFPMRTRGDEIVLMDYLIFDGNIGTGSLATFTEIDFDAWYNTTTRRPATSRDKQGLSIPRNLKANHRQIRFQFDAQHHVFAFVAKHGKISR